ncbi:hypothetical protein C8R47DRAFT_1228891 [Mycena vitilis]|nr:hypothetical protein C8R47DRAFT_1228891 [Mycena vitilis]
MTGPTTDDDGYQSDTGPQENPTALLYNRRAINRKGRAICRIVHAHGWKIAHISKIFNVPRRRIDKAVKNTYFSPDDELKDYDCVGQEFQEKFPPIKIHKKRRGRISGSADSKGLNTGKMKVTKTVPAAILGLKLARLPAPATIAAFLEGAGLSKHLALFEARGFKDVSILGIIARFDDYTLRDTLRRFLTENMEELEGMDDDSNGVGTFTAAR